MVKLEFTNAFNRVRRDTILISVADKMPELYCFVHASLDCSPQLSYGNDIIASAEGYQQGDSLSNVEYCDVVQPTLMETTSRTKLGYVDDTNLEGRISAVANDVQHIIDSFPTTGLILNAHKCEIISNNFDQIDKFPVFKDFRRVAKEDLILLGAPILEGKAVDKALIAKITDLERSVERLSLLPPHYALCLLKNALAMPKLRYILRTSPCAGNYCLLSTTCCAVVCQQF